MSDQLTFEELDDLASGLWVLTEVSGDETAYEESTYVSE
jgi:hypothetical protein